MPQNVYECLFILDSNRYARDPNGVSGSIPTMVQKLGGEVLASRMWTEQKLAYPISGHRKGTYWLTYFRMDSQRLTEFKRACQLNEAIVRNLVLRVDPRLADALVSHALGKSAGVKEGGSSGGDSDKPERGEKAEKPEKGERGEKPERPAKSERPERVMKS